LVEGAGAAHGAGALRPLNAPVPLKVQATAAGRPLRVHLNGRWQVVAAVEDAWRVEDEWWRARPLSRTYLGVLLADGRRVTLYRDGTGDWFEQRYG
jgi:hypothetical protein